MWYTFYLMSKQFFIFKVHFHSILQCQIETLRQTCWVTDDQLLFKTSGILTRESQLWWNCHLTFIQNLSWVVNFFKCLVNILYDFCMEIVRWGSSFQSKFVCEYFKLVKYPTCFITIQSILKMMITSVFFQNVWKNN